MIAQGWGEWGGGGGGVKGARGDRDGFLFGTRKHHPKPDCGELYGKYTKLSEKGRDVYMGQPGDPPQGGNAEFSHTVLLSYL